MPRLVFATLCLCLAGCGVAGDVCVDENLPCLVNNCSNYAASTITLKYGGMQCAYKVSDMAASKACLAQVKQYCNGNPDGGSGGGAGGGTGGGTGGGSGGGSGGGGGAGGGGPPVVTVIALGQGSTRAMVVDATHIYWTAGSKVIKAQLDGGGLLDLAINQNSPAGIAVDATSVYWVNSNATGTVMKVPLSGGTAVTLASSQSFPQKLVVSGGGVYWTATTAIRSASKSGGTVSTLASGVLGAYAIALDSTYVYWTAQGAGGLGTVARVDLVGGTPQTLVVADAGVTLGDLAVDADHVYWTTGNTVSKLSLDGGAVVALAPAEYNAIAITVDANRAYWLNAGATAGGVSSVPLAGGTPTIAAPAMFNGAAMTQDATRVYWVGNSSLLSAPK